MVSYLLAGDIGGTKTTLAIYASEENQPLILVREAWFPSQYYEGVEPMLHGFLRSGKETIAAAALGLPGPVLEGEVQTTNLPWHVTTASVAQVIDCPRVRLMNDLETTAYGALFLPAADIQVLNVGAPRRGNRAVIAAGTGLGQAFLFWDGTHYRPVATEGGHVDFAPQTEQDLDLLRFLQQQYGRVSYERLLSGPGLFNIFSYLAQEQQKPVEPSVRDRLQQEDPAVVIGQAAVTGLCATCEEAVQIFLRLYAAQAGNLALTVMALGGVYIGGGMITKLLPRLDAGAFLRAFADKGRYAHFMTEIPVSVLLNPAASQLGAAHAARDLLTQ
jgi:glucokinase